MPKRNGLIMLNLQKAWAKNYMSIYVSVLFNIHKLLCGQNSLYLTDKSDN